VGGGFISVASVSPSLLSLKVLSFVSVASVSPSLLSLNVLCIRRFYVSLLRVCMSCAGGECSSVSPPRISNSVAMSCNLKSGLIRTCAGPFWRDQAPKNDSAVVETLASASSATSRVALFCASGVTVQTWTKGVGCEMTVRPPRLRWFTDTVYSSYNSTRRLG
jgi:hypothetical protein